MYTRRGLPGERESDNKGSSRALPPFRAVFRRPARIPGVSSAEQGWRFIFGVNELADSISVEVISDSEFESVRARNGEIAR